MVFILVLVLAGVLAGSTAITLAPVLQRARVVRALAGAAVLLPEQDLKQPFLCLRPPLEGKAARALRNSTWEQLQAGPDSPGQARLRLAASCLLGEYPAVAADRQVSGPDPYLSFQWAMIQKAGSEEERLRELISAGLGPDELLVFASAITANKIEFDVRPLLRELGRSIPQEKKLWQLWLQAGLKLEQQAEWDGARDWYQEGRALQAGAGVQVYASSFVLHLGRYYQAYSEPRQPQAALDYFAQALKIGEWRFSNEASATHLYRGEVYRSLREAYTPEQALAEFEQALALDPQSYWAELAIGHLYKQDLQDPAQAEAYYRQALAKRPELPVAYYYLAELYRAGGELSLAESWYRQALAIQPDFQPALDRLQTLEADP
jgi:tetratricopeptide (TPR) repeat protein